MTLRAKEENTVLDPRNRKLLLLRRKFYFAGTGSFSRKKPSHHRVTATPPLPIFYYLPDIITAASLEPRRRSPSPLPSHRPNSHRHFIIEPHSAREKTRNGILSLICGACFRCDFVKVDFWFECYKERGLMHPH